MITTLAFSDNVYLMVLTEDPFGINGSGLSLIEVIDGLRRSIVIVPVIGVAARPARSTAVILYV